MESESFTLISQRRAGNPNPLAARECDCIGLVGRLDLLASISGGEAELGGAQPRRCRASGSLHSSRGAVTHQSQKMQSLGQRMFSRVNLLRFDYRTDDGISSALRIIVSND